MLHAGQSAAVDSTYAFEEDSGHNSDIVTQAPVRDASAAVSAWLVRGNYVSGSFQISSVPAEATPHHDYTGYTQDADGHAPVLALPQRPRRVPAATFHALQEWEGYVLAIGRQEFEARLIDMTTGGTYEGEEATIPLLEISDHDAKKLRIGAIFRWVIGYLNTAGGSRKRVSEIVFRDLPAVTKSDLRDGEEWARSMFQSLNP